MRDPHLSIGQPAHGGLPISLNLLPNSLAQFSCTANGTSRAPPFGMNHMNLVPRRRRHFELHAPKKNLKSATHGAAEAVAGGLLIHPDLLTRTDLHLFC